MKTILGTTFLLALFACSNPNKKIEQIVAQADTSKKGVHFEDFPRDSNLVAKILPHRDFYWCWNWKDADKEKWMGLFNNGKGYTVKEAKIKIDIVQDKNNELCDQYASIAVSGGLPAFMLISGVDLQIDHKVEPIRIEESRPAPGHDREQLFPGDSVPYNYNGVDYLLYATGEKTEPDTAVETEGVDVRNYRLFLRAKINGNTIDELLVARSHYIEEDLGSVVFIGDIDADNIPDLIIDASVGGHQGNNTLYLSKPADKGHILKVVAQYTWGGD